MAGKTRALKNLPEGTFFVVDDLQGNIHVCQASWSYKVGDPATASDVQLLQGYLAQLKRLPAVQIGVVAAATTNQTIQSNT